MEKLPIEIEKTEKITDPVEIKKELSEAFSEIKKLADRGNHLILPDDTEIAGIDFSGKTLMSALSMINKELEVFEYDNSQKTETEENEGDESEQEAISDWLSAYPDLIRDPEENEKVFWNIQGKQAGDKVTVKYTRRHDALSPGRKVPEQNISLDSTENIFNVKEWKVAENIFKKYERLEDKVENGAPEEKREAKKEMLAILKEEKFRRWMMKEDGDRLKKDKEGNLTEEERFPMAESETKLQKEIKSFVERYKALGALPKDFDDKDFENKIINILSQAVLLNSMPVDQRRIPKLKEEIKEIPSFAINLENISHAFDRQLKTKKGFALLLGEAGTGKNEAIEYFAAKTNRPLYVMSAGRGMDAHDLMVTDDFSPDEGKISHFTEFISGIQTPGAVVMLDEANALLPQVQAILHGFADGRREVKYNGFDFKLADDVLVVIAGNPATYSAANDMGQALVSRTLGQGIEMDYPALKKADLMERVNSWSNLDKLKAELEDNSIRTEYLADEVLATYTSIPEFKDINETEFKLLWNYYVNENTELDIEIKENNKLNDLIDSPETRKTFIDLRDILEIADEWRKKYKEGDGNFSLYGLGMRDTIAVTDSYGENRDVKKSWLDTYKTFRVQPIEGTDELYKDLESLLKQKLG